MTSTSVFRGGVLVALDIDGTLTDHGGPVSGAVRRAFNELVDAGFHVILATGRNIEGMMVVAGELGVRDSFAVCSNGAVLAEVDTNLTHPFRVVETSNFNPATTVGAVREILPEAVMAVEVPGAGFRVSSRFAPGELYGEQKVESFDSLASRPAPRVVVRAQDMTSKEMVAVIDAAQVPHVEYSVGWTVWMDFVGEGVTKAKGLEVVRHRLGVSAAGTFAIGDGVNDIPMLRWAAHGIAMGNSRPDVLAAASETTETVENDGAARALRRIAALL